MDEWMDEMKDEQTNKRMLYLHTISNQHGWWGPVCVYDSVLKSI